MKSKITVTGYARGLNRWHDETGPFHAMKDKPEGVYMFSVAVCGASPRSFSGNQPLPSTAHLCRRCARILGVNQ